MGGLLDRKNGRKQIFYSMKLVIHYFFISKIYAKYIIENNDDICKPSLWDEWTDELDCFWQDNDEKWWFSSSQGNARGSEKWENWNSGLTSDMGRRFSDFDHSKYYDPKHQKVCTPNGQVSVSKVKFDETISECENPSKVLS